MQTLSLLKPVLFVGLLVCNVFHCHSFDQEDKPNIWVYSDLSDPSVTTNTGHPINDPDDIVSLAALLLNADRFNIINIVVGSTNRGAQNNPLPFLKETFISAYNHDATLFRQGGLDFPTHVPFTWSSLTQGANPISFNIDNDYRTLDNFPSVSALAKYASDQPVTVLNWGPLTETAILLNHLIATRNIDALNNLRIVSHWTTSFHHQGSIDHPHNVANCLDDLNACRYVKDVAKRHGIKFYELGSSGQSGLVNASKNTIREPYFEHSRLGQLFNRAKFYFGKQDQSDGATFWILLNETHSKEPIDLSLDDAVLFNHFTPNSEACLIARFKEVSASIMLLLNERAKLIADSSANTPFTQQQIANWFTYAYKKNGKVEIVAPYQKMQFSIWSESNELITSGMLLRGNQYVDIDTDSAITVKITMGQWQKSFSL